VVDSIPAALIAAHRQASVAEAVRARAAATKATGSFGFYIIEQHETHRSEQDQHGGTCLAGESILERGNVESAVFMPIPSPKVRITTAAKP
jgi:hypothetical protein